jgi:hypothetical protein
MGGALRVAGVLACALCLDACDVNVHDQTPDEYQADHRLGMYEVKASLDRDAMVGPGSVFVSAIIDDQAVPLEADREKAEWQALYAVRCRSSFQLQYRAVWSIQSITTRAKLFPDHPRTVHLAEPPLTQDALIDTSAKGAKDWSGVVHYQFVTADNTEIKSGHIEPFSQDPADVQAAAAISVTSAMPLTAPCATPVDVAVSSKAQTAHGYLVIETNSPSAPTWRTKLEFAPAVASRR